MATCSTAHAKDEKAIVDAFLAAHPAFAAEIRGCRQPDDEFPDVIAVMKEGPYLGIEAREFAGMADLAAKVVAGQTAFDLRESTC